MRKTQARHEWGGGQMKTHVSFKAGLASHDVDNNDEAWIMSHQALLICCVWILKFPMVIIWMACPFNHE